MAVFPTCGSIRTNKVMNKNRYIKPIVAVELLDVVYVICGSGSDTIYITPGSQPVSPEYDQDGNTTSEVKGNPYTFDY